MDSTRRSPSATPGAVVLFATFVALLTTLPFGGSIPGGPPNAEAALRPPPFAATDSTILEGLHWRLLPAAPCQSDSVVLVFDACTCNIDFVSGGRIDASHARVELNLRPDILCFLCNPDSMQVVLGVYPPGSHEIDLLAVANVMHADGTTEIVEKHFLLPFFVRDECGPPPLLIPYLEQVVIGRGAPCPDCPATVCPADSIPVLFKGMFPNACIQLAGVRLSPSPVVGPLPEPDIVELLFKDISRCGGCSQAAQAWRSEVRLPPLPPRAYQLIVRAVEVACPDSTITFLGSANVPFVVAQTCSTDTGCFTANFGHARDSACEARVGADRPAVLDLAVSTGVALAGLQGDLVLDRPGLRIGKLEAVGNAADMMLSWTRTEMGARFVLFAPSGAPIVPALGSPVLAVTIEAVPGVPIPEVTILRPERLVAADINGGGVRQCPSIETVIGLGARICRDAPCDMNGDGVTDVRDLIVMVHCVIDPAGACPEQARTQLDCNHDTFENIDDVLCCARVLLSGARPDSVIGGRDAPGVTVGIDEVRPVSGGVDVALTVKGVEFLGAARLDLEYPADRYDVTGVEFAVDVGTNWLELHEFGSGQLSIGLIGNSSVAASLAPGGTMSLPLIVHLQLRAGQAGGGQVRFTGGDFAGPDGVALETGARPVVIPLGNGETVALGTAYPNPLRREAHFALTLAAAGDVDIAVFDLAGRRIATVYKGHMQAGTRLFTWQRTRDDGRDVASGVYFYRATAGHQVVSRKLMVLSRE